MSDQMVDPFEDALAEFDQRLGIEPEQEAPAEADTADEQPDNTPEPQAEAPQEAQEAEAPEPSGERERDEQGRFLPKEQPEVLEKRIADKDEFIGRQSNEIGELRERLARLEGRAEATPEPQAPATPQVSTEQFDEIIERNPAGAAAWAAQYDPSGTLLDRALEYWHDVDPRRAAAFERQQELQKLEERFSQRLQETTAPLGEMTAMRSLENAWEYGRSKFPDFDERAEQILEAARFAPALANDLQSQDPAEQQKAAESLYYIAAGMSRNAGSAEPQQTGEEDAAATAALTQAARNAKLSGAVTSQTQSGEAEVKDPGDQWLEDIGFDAYLDSRDID